MYVKQNGRTNRGYGHRHQQERKRWAPRVERGEVHCARCHRLINPGSEWHLDHNADRTGYLGPSHARCNTRAAGRLGAKIANPRRRKTRWQSRPW